MNHEHCCASAGASILKGVSTAMLGGQPFTLSRRFQRRAASTRHAFAMTHHAPPAPASPVPREIPLPHVRWHNTCTAGTRRLRAIVIEDAAKTNGSCSSVGIPTRPRPQVSVARPGAGDGYEELEIPNGGAADVVKLRRLLFDDDMSRAEREQTRKALLQYRAVDTLGVVRLLERVRTTPYQQPD